MEWKWKIIHIHVRNIVSAVIKVSGKSRWQEYKEKNGVTPLDILNPNTKMVESFISSQRFSICSNCEFLTKITNQCKKCGCFMHLKTKIEKAQCPVGKW